MVSSSLAAWLPGIAQMKTGFQGQGCAGQTPSARPVSRPAPHARKTPHARPRVPRPLPDSTRASRSRRPNSFCRVIGPVTFPALPTQGHPNRPRPSATDSRQAQTDTRGCGPLVSAAARQVRQIAPNRDQLRSMFSTISGHLEHCPHFCVKRLVAAGSWVRLRSWKHVLAAHFVVVPRSPGQIPRPRHASIYLRLRSARPPRAPG